MTDPKMISTPSRYIYNSYLMKQGPDDSIALHRTSVYGHINKHFLIETLCHQILVGASTFVYDYSAG